MTGFKYNIQHLLLFAGFMVCGQLFSCKAKQAGQAAAPEEKCAFYNIKLTRDSVLNKTSAEITHVNIVDTKVRYVPDESKASEPSFLKIIIIHPGDKKTYAYTEHPLYKRLDLYSESGKIESKSISLSQGQVFLRIPYFGKFKKMIITETVNFKESPTLIVLK